MVLNMFCAHLIVSRFAAAAAAAPTVILNNGVEMPMMSLGTANGNASEIELNVRTALRVGWTAVDAALNYGNQEGIGRALADVERSSVFLTTKVGGAPPLPSFFIKNVYNRTLEEAYQDLKELNVDYVDLLLIHTPPGPLAPWLWGERSCRYMQEQWRALEDFMSSGKARAIGVSNYCPSDLACILETATVVPAVNQVKFHVGMGPDPRGVVSHNEALGITTMAWEPLVAIDYSTGDKNAPKDYSLLKGNFTNDIGQPYGKSGAQVALRWIVQHGVLLATESSSEKHLQEDLDVFEFTLDDKDMQQLDDATTPYGEPNGFYVNVPVCESTGFATTV